MIIFQTVEFAASFVEAMIGILISIKVLGEENIRIRDNIIASFIVAIVIWIINQYKIFSILATIFGVISIAACTCLIYKKKIFDSLISVSYTHLPTWCREIFSCWRPGIWWRQTGVSWRRIPC